jgi:hypothetical protein
MASKDLQRDLVTSENDIDASTLRRRLLEAGRKAREPIKKQLLTPALKQKRLAWSNMYRSWTSDDWKKVAFSDEYIFLFKVTDQVLSDEAVMNP